MFYKLLIKDSNDQSVRILATFEHGLLFPRSGTWLPLGERGLIQAARMEEDNIFKVVRSDQGNLQAEFYWRSPDDGQLYPVLTLEAVSKSLPTVWEPKGTGTLLQGTADKLKSGVISWYLL